MTHTRRSPAPALRLAFGSLALAITTACATAAPGTPPASASRPDTSAPMANTITAPGFIPLERVMASPALSGPTPRALAFSPDGKRVTFLQPRADDQARLDLWAFDVATGQSRMLVDSTVLDPADAELSEEEKALRERKRITGTRGFVQYQWDAQGRFILVPAGGDVWLIDLQAQGTPARKITDTPEFEYDAKVSPAGRFVSFIREGALYAVEIATGTETRLSPAAEPDKAVSYGVAEFVAQEEMSRFTGYWWSPDDTHVAFTRVDESTVDIIPRFDIASSGTTVVEQRYPRAGRPNAVVDLFVRDMSTGVSRQLARFGPDTYLARVNWQDRNTIWFQEVDRDQTRITHHTSIGPTFRVWSPFTETQPNWVNLSSDFALVGDDATIVRSDEDDGFRHLSLRRGQSGARVALTSGEWAVDALAAIDRNAGLVYFTGWKDTPLERHLYSVPLAGGEPRRITALGSSWSVTMSPDGQSFIATSSSPDQPPQVGLYRADGSRITWIEENRLDENHPYFPHLKAHSSTEYGTLTASDGQVMHYSILKPPGFDPARRYPVILEVYGGPHVQRVTRDWESPQDQFFAQQGYIVFRLDNRGSFNRGKRFEDVIFRQTGGPEVADQLLGVNWLKSQPFVDPDRIAIQGWSYGGYMTLMVFLQAAPDTFAAAVSGAPVTDWTLYDTFYTERYMDTPQDNADGYAKSSVFYHLDRWQGELPPLLLVHGMADDNVTFDNSTRLMAALQERGLVFDLMTYPGQRHGIRGEALSTHLLRTRMAFLNRHLKGG